MLHHSQDQRDRTVSETTASAHTVPHMANTMVPPVILMDAVNKWFGSLHVLKDVSISVAEKERVVVCGPSGSGKSTMICCINRLETLSARPNYRGWD